MGYLFGQKRRKVSRLQRQAARCFLVTQEASSVEVWHVVLAECSADRKAAADGMRVIIDESGGAIGWRAECGHFREPVGQGVAANYGAWPLLFQPLRTELARAGLF